MGRPDEVNVEREVPDEVIEEQESVECRRSQLELGGMCRFGFGHSCETPCHSNSMRVGRHVGGYMSVLPQKTLDDMQI